jgi:hypothetical protein
MKKLKHSEHTKSVKSRQNGRILMEILNYKQQGGSDKERPWKR